MMLAELSEVIANVPRHSSVGDYREAILQQNVLGKATDSTRRSRYDVFANCMRLMKRRPSLGPCENCKP
jgi:hypothetical protein